MRIAPNPYQWNRINLDVFYGRKQLLDDVITELQRGYSHAIVGGRKMGKTTLLRKIEQVLTTEIKSSVSAGSLMLPVYIDMLSFSSPLTAKAIYVDIVRQLDRKLKEIGLLGKSYPSAVPVFGEFPREENRAFTKIVKKYIEEIHEQCFFRIGVLIDEIEPITVTEWGDGFFGNWRHLLSNEPDVSSYISIVLAGAKEMFHIAKDIGSPLANILTWQELSLFSKKDTDDLVNTPTQALLPDSVSGKIFSWTGGHPFLIQYLMHHICEYDTDEAEVRLREARRLFQTKQDAQFRNWWFEKFNDEDRRCYAFLAGSRKVMPKRNLIDLFGDMQANNSLSVLCHTGVANKSQKREHYKVAGTMFKEWFQTHGIHSASLSAYDKDIYKKLQVLSPEIASRYVSAWAIQAAELPNYSGAVSEIREVITKVLHKLAPDDKVKAQPGYKPELDKYKNPLKKPTRKQRTRFIMKNRGKKTKKAKPIEAEMELLETFMEQLSKVVGIGYDHASARTHTSATCEQAWKCLKQLDSILAQLL